MTQSSFEDLKKKALVFRFDTPQDRIARLQKLLNWINSHEEDIFKALEADFNKPRFETTISEIFPVVTEIKYTIKNLKKWMRPKKVGTPLVLLGHKSSIRYENKGVVLIIAPWNYPFQLAVVPLVSALAAGNTVIIKPSELTPHTSTLIHRMIESVFNLDEVRVELGAKEKTEELLQYRFDHVFFTGSTAVGRVVAKACADKLIPTTLELGGKSPTIIDETADLDEASDKIFWGKYLNRAQTCVAPDYLLVHESVADHLVQKIRTISAQFDKENKGRIITPRHQERLQKMLNQEVDLNMRTLELVEVKNTSHPAMQDEIFGPVLPYLKYKNIEEIDAIISAYEKPLSFYIFSKDKDRVNRILNKFPSGGVGINSVLLQFGNHHLPFGGIGHSGSGEYHGYYGFLEMSHARAVIESRYFGFLRKILMPPYTPFKFNILELIKKI
jgi:aldehyde dehydrogenase (NAD+)